MTRRIVKTAAAARDTSTGNWEVDLSFTSKGSTEFNYYAAEYYRCYEEDDSDPLTP